jgi:hypothetical protein
VGDTDTRAALVGRASEADLLTALLAQVDPAEVARIQLEVMTGELVPEY